VRKFGGGTDHQEEGLPSPFCGARSKHKACHRRAPDDEQLDHGLAAFLPHQNAEHESTHADYREDCADDIDMTWTGVWHIFDQANPRKNDQDDQILEKERDPP
jgi:hypothetical protein